MNTAIDVSYKRVYYNYWFVLVTTLSRGKYYFMPFSVFFRHLDIVLPAGKRTALCLFLLFCSP